MKLIAQKASPPGVQPRPAAPASAAPHGAAFHPGANRWHGCAIEQLLLWPVAVFEARARTEAGGLRARAKAVLRREGVVSKAAQDKTLSV